MQLLDQMHLHLTTDTGKELTKKVPKIRPITLCSPRIDCKVLLFSLPGLQPDNLTS
jgi:hypothetical protein